MNIYKIIPCRSKFTSAYDLFKWLEGYTGVSASSCNYKTYESVRYGIVLETSLYSESELDNLIYPHEAIQVD